MSRKEKSASKKEKKIVEREESETGSSESTVSMASEGESVGECSGSGSGSESLDSESSASEPGIEEETSSGSESECEAKSDACKTIFMKGLNYDLTEYDLKSEMEKIGKVVRVGIPVTNDKKRNKGFGYVEFEREEDVKKALKLNRTMFLGREVIIDMANPRSNKQKHTIYVSNIPFECDKKKLRSYFEEMGEVVGMSLPYDRENDRLKGYGFVDYGNKDDYEAVLNRKLVFEDSDLHQRPANKNGGNRVSGDRKGSGGRFRDDFRERGFGNGGDGFREKDRRRHELDAQNRSNKKVKFDSDDE